MKESQLLGALLPSSPDVFPIIEIVRKKYNLHEVSLNSEPIEEIYLGDRSVSLEGFRQDIGDILRQDLRFFQPDTIKQYKSAKLFSQPVKLEGLEVLPADYKAGIEVLIAITQKMSEPMLQGLEVFIDSLADMIYEYVLTGEAGEVPADWFSKAMTGKFDGETAVIIMASQISDPEEIVQQFRHEYNKAFGAYRPKISKKNVSAGYYLQLKRLKKSWEFIAEEYIRLEKISLPRDRSSKRYADRLRQCQQAVKKRMQRSEKVLDVILRDKK